MPNGEDFPFAQKMIQHFKKLETPLQSVTKYPQLADQERRFRDAGWSSVTARSLWNLWLDSSFVSSAQRIALNSVENFDEWEELALFASHYCLLVASQTSSEQHPMYITPRPDPVPELLFTQPTVERLSLTQHAEPLSKTDDQRRFGAVLPISQDIVGHHGGLGRQRRLNSVNLYKSDSAVHAKANLPPLTMEPRMCHTITTFDGNCCLLFGGRTSPDCALSDCWLYSEATWNRVANAPTPLYRHCATAVSLGVIGQGILIYGGKSTREMVMNDWYLWHASKGWAKVSVSGAQIKPRFGAVMASNDTQQGFLLGGMTEDGVVLSEKWNWSLRDLETNPIIELTGNDELTGLATSHLAVIGRFGSCLIWSSAGLLLVGGITKRLLPQKLDILCLCQSRTSLRDHRFKAPNPVPIDFASPGGPALLIGHCAFTSKDSLIIFGGGAVCFSFGTHWNQYVWTLRIQSNEQTSRWCLDKHKGCISRADPNEIHMEDLVQPTGLVSQDGRAVESIERTPIKSSQEFERRLQFSKPFVMEDLDLGPCITEWTLDNLETKIGADQSVRLARSTIIRFSDILQVIVHEAADQQMDFQKKNFTYATKPFGAFVAQIKGGSKQYLRSLAAEKPAVKPADFASDFPNLRPDFKLPHQLNTVKQNAHSAPLRISGPVTMWLHYDVGLRRYLSSTKLTVQVMANILCQIRGLKRIILYPPSDVLHLDIPPGGSSSSIRVFDTDAAVKYPCLQRTHPHESILRPGDVLFIPPLWLHTASPTENLSVSVNIFFRNLVESAYAKGRDVYGNRDLEAYENGRREVDKIAHAFVGLPREMGQFYLARLAEELHQRSLGHGQA